MTRATELRQRFRQLHHDPPPSPTPGILVLPIPWDVGSAKVLEAIGALAVATTSAGFANALGRLDQQITRDELVAHVDELAQAVDVPLNVDAEDCFGTDTAGVVQTVEMLVTTDAAGFSIEDYDPRTDAIRSVEVATERVAAARSVDADIVLTARAENLLHGVRDLDDTIARLESYRDAGADVVYAPGLRDIAEISRVVEAVGIPVNVLALPFAPPIRELAGAGVSRVSLGSLLALKAYGALVEAAGELLGPGTSTYASGLLTNEVRDVAFGGDGRERDR